MRLSIADDGLEILKMDYCSAYGKGAARLVRDAVGKNYVLLTHSEGHGTGIGIDYLDVYGLSRTVSNVPIDQDNVLEDRSKKNSKTLRSKSKMSRESGAQAGAKSEWVFTKFVRTEISIPIGMRSRMDYVYRIEKPKLGGLRLVLKRHTTSTDYDRNFGLCCVPAELTKIIQIDTK